MVVVTNLPPPTEGVRHVQSETVALLNNTNLGNGTLYITESCVSWVDQTHGNGFSLQYPHISVHAISRQRASYPQECLYLMIDTALEDVVFSNTQSSTEASADDASDEESSENDITEIRFIPEDKNSLEVLFKTLSECQTLHPDPEALSGTVNGIEPMETSQFEDAEDNG